MWFINGEQVSLDQIYKKTVGRNVCTSTTGTQFDGEMVKGGPMILSIDLIHGTQQ